MRRSDKRTINKKKRKRRIISSIIILLLVLVGTGVYIVTNAFQAINESYNDLGREKSDLREKPVTIKDPFSILLMGIEDYSTGGKNGRTDALLVATFNPDDQRIKLLSIPRDTLTEINEDGTLNKINAAHVFGGVEGTIYAVENLLEIPIDYYAKVDFDGFVNIIDILGGVEVNVPFDFSQDSLDGNIYYFTEGPMELNGDEALAFVRMRKQDATGDIGRNARQQEVIKGIVDKLVSFGTITKIDDLAKEIGTNVETNFKISDGLGLYTQLTNFSKNNIDQIKLETYPDWYGSASVQIPYEESLLEVQTTLKEHLGLIEPSVTQDTDNTSDNS